MHHEDRDAHRVMAEAVDSQSDWTWHDSMAGKVAFYKGLSNNGYGWENDYGKATPEDMRTYFGNDPVVVFPPPTMQERMDQVKRDRAARLIEEAVIIATFLTVIVGLMFTPALWHWARALWGAIHG